MTKHQTVKTHCAKGHPFDEENTYYKKTGRGRRCRKCHIERCRADRAPANPAKPRSMSERDTRNRARITPTQHANNVAGLLHYLERRRDRIERDRAKQESERVA